MGPWSLWHWLVVLLVVVLVFGTKKLKNVGADLGAAVKGFKDGMRQGASDEDEKAVATPALDAAAAAAEKTTIDVVSKEKV